MLAALVPAHANDTLATLGAGGLVPLKSSTIVMESEDLEISVNKVRVRYVFRNTSGRDVEAVVAFPLPELDGGLVANSPVLLPSKDALNFVEFRVLVGGRSMTAGVEERAFFDGREITADLRSLGLPVSVVDETVTGAFRKAPPQERVRFENNGWMDCSLSRDGKCWPLWQTRSQFYWTQRFPAGAAVEVEQSYRPVIGGGYITTEDTGDWAVKPYCGGADTLGQIRKLKALHAARIADRLALVERRIQYVLTTANNWSGPIRTFRLAVISDSADDVVVTCMPGLRRTAPTRYEMVRSDFRPDRELDVLFLQAAH